MQQLVLRSILSPSIEAEARLLQQWEGTALSKRSILKPWLPWVCVCFPAATWEQARQSRDQLEKVLEESRRAAAEAETARRQQAEAEKQSATLKRAALEGEREIGQKEKRVMEAQEELEKER